MTSKEDQDRWFSQGAYMGLGFLLSYTIWLFLRWLGFGVGRLVSETVMELLS